MIRKVRVNIEVTVIHVHTIAGCYQAVCLMCSDRLNNSILHNYYTNTSDIFFYQREVPDQFITVDDNIS